MKCPCPTASGTALQREKLEEMLALSLLLLLAFSACQRSGGAGNTPPLAGHLRGWDPSGFPNTTPSEPPGLAGKWAACGMRDGSGHSNHQI